VLRAEVEQYARDTCSSTPGGRSAVTERRQPTREQLLARISVDPQVAHGRPTVRGTRVWVTTVLDWLADGRTHEEILQEYPQLEPDDIQACVAYGAELTRFHDVSVEPV
jgi:uncharacterized protein (DUF433 family)